jgi:hypothetical protein
VEGFDRKRLPIVVGAMVVTLLGGTVGFLAILDESWRAALYRTIAIVLAGVAIFGYLAAQVVDSTAHGIIGGTWREKQRRRMIDQIKPSKDTLLEERDVMVGIGAPDAIRKLERMFGSREALAT